MTANVIHPGEVKTAMWAEIRDEAERLGEVAAPLARWAAWVDETGGDPPSKAVDLVVRIDRERRERAVPLDRRAAASADPELGRLGSQRGRA